jgi:hypothetical protein
MIRGLKICFVDYYVVCVGSRLLAIFNGVGTKVLTLIEPELLDGIQLFIQVSIFQCPFESP